jgi:hypothetical protein
MSIVARATSLLLWLFLLEFAFCVGVESSGAQTSPESLHQLFKQRYQLHGLISEQGQKLFPLREIGATGAFAQMGIPTDEESKSI